MTKTSEQWLPTRVSLLNRMKDLDDQDSWNQFFNIYRKLIYGTAIKAGLSAHEAEEALQETVISVAKTIKNFRYDQQHCRFKTWLLHLTRKRVVDQFRKRAREKAQPARAQSDTTATHPMERVADPAGVNLDAVWEEEWRTRILDAALERVKQKVEVEQYQIFDFYVLRKMSAGEVASTLGVNIGQVYLAKHRVEKLVKKEAKLLESKMG